MKIFAIVVAALATMSASGQDYAFKILISKGTNQVKAGKDWQPVKVGASLRSADELKISQNGYIGLVHVSGKPLEVKDPGQHKVVELAAKIKQGSSVLHQYTDFILSTNNEKRNNLTATGAVHRGPDEIKVFLPRSQHAIVFNDHIAIAWAKQRDTQTYVVRFNSMFGDELEKIEVQDTTVLVNLGGEKFSNEDNILVEVSSKSDPRKVSEPMMLKKMSAADKKRLSNSLGEIMAHTSEQTALNQLYLASFYESHRLLIDAATAHRLAIRLAPGVPHFQEAYSEFLVRNAMTN